VVYGIIAIDAFLGLTLVLRAE